ncbi:MAG TPA: hypothetical protein V6C58_13480 [Allocoleopsis sp.]
MEIITLKVDNEVAKAYQEATPIKQQNANLICNLVLKEIFKPSSFREIVSQIRQETAANGLTPEILEELLNND